MVKETGFALVLMIVVAAFSADGQAAVLAEWLLDESQITVDVTTAADTTDVRASQFSISPRGTHPIR